MKMPKVVEGKIANIVIPIWGFDFFTNLTNQLDSDTLVFFKLNFITSQYLVQLHPIEDDE